MAFWRLSALSFSFPSSTALRSGPLALGGCNFEACERFALAKPERNCIHQGPATAEQSVEETFPCPKGSSCVVFHKTAPVGAKMVHFHPSERSEQKWKLSKISDNTFPGFTQVVAASRSDERKWDVLGVLTTAPLKSHAFAATHSTPLPPTSRCKSCPRRKLLLWF